MRWLLTLYDVRSLGGRKWMKTRPKWVWQEVRRNERSINRVKECEWGNYYCCRDVSVCRLRFTALRLIPATNLKISVTVDYSDWDIFIFFIFLFSFHNYLEYLLSIFNLYSFFLLCIVYMSWLFGFYHTQNSDLIKYIDLDKIK